MRAAVIENFQEPIVIRDVPDPIPRAGEVLVRVRAAGICGTDVKVTTGVIPGLQLPLIPGHEVAGELLEDVGDLRAGQRVAAFIFQPCGRCQWCLRGEDTQCSASPRIGFERDGGLAEFIRMRPSDLLPFSESLDFAKAAVSMDALLTPWRALRTRAKVADGDHVLIVGAGGLGLHAVQVARAAGARVAVLDVSEPARQFALSLGADLAVGPEELDAVRVWCIEGVDVVLEASGALPGFSAAMSLVRASGTIVCCGYRPGQDLAVDSMKLALSEVNVIGSRSGTLDDARAALGAVEAGLVAPLVADVGTIDDTPKFLERLRTEGAPGRLVVEF